MKSKRSIRNRFPSSIREKRRDSRC